MATNRLYIYDPETEEACLLAKALGGFWGLWDAEMLEDWLAGKHDVVDLVATTTVGAPTQLVLKTEGELDASGYNWEEHHARWDRRRAV